MGMHHNDPYYSYEKTSSVACTTEGMQLQIERATRYSFDQYIEHYGELSHSGICFKPEEFASKLSELKEGGWIPAVKLQGHFRTHCLSANDPFCIITDGKRIEYLVCAFILINTYGLTEVCLASSEHLEKPLSLRDARINLLEEAGQKITSLYPDYEYIVSSEGKFAPMRLKKSVIEQ
jgi:hypothetical protein